MANEAKRTDGASTVASEDDLLTRSRNVKWYVKDLGDLSEPMREVLEKYSHVPPDQVREHVYDLREKGWEIFPFPCIGGWRFLDLILYAMPQYSDIVSRIKQGDKFLDLGCCFGQEIRRLIYDGAPAENLYGSDLRPEFLDLGYDLFLDRETCKATFFAADAFDGSNRLIDLSGTISVMCTNAFFHLFDRPEQMQLARLATKLLKPEPGSIVLGRQVGSTQPGPYEHGTNGGGIMWRHSVETWRALWDEVGKETGVKWKVEGELRDLWRNMNNKMADEHVRELRFCVTRL